MSGGVGKSTLTVNLGFHLAQTSGKKVLLVDMDPQASLTTFLGFNPFDIESTIYKGLLSKELQPLNADSVECDLIPSNI
ncbi:MAG: ParA family protein, partial [Cyanobacteria bacterium J06553_1]